MNAPRGRRHERRRWIVYWFLAWVAVLSEGGLRAEPDPSPPDSARGSPPARLAPDREGRLPTTGPAERPPRPAPATNSPPSPPDAARPPRPASPARTAPTTAPAAQAVPASAATPIEPDSLESDAAQEERFVTRRRLNHVLYRDRRYRLLLDQVAEAHQRGEILKLCELIHEISSAPEDVFVWEDSVQQPISARDAAGRCIAELTPAERAAYERYIGAAADAALAELLRAGQLGQLPAFIQKYPGSEAAFRADVLLVRQLFDSGRLTEAAAGWRKIMADPRAQSLPPADRLQAAVAARLAGDDVTADRLTAQNTIQLRVGDDQRRSMTEASALAVSGLQAHPSFAASTPASWAMHSGSREGSLATTGSLPHPVPLWSSRPQPKLDAATLPFPGDWQLSLPEQAVEEFVDPSTQWLQAQSDDGVPPVSATLPIVVNGQIIVRELQALVARDLETGRTLWRHKCQSPLQGLAQPVQTDHDGTASPEGAYTQRAAENSLLSAISTDGLHLFYVDGLEEIPAPSIDDVGLSTPETTPTVPRQLVNRLVALRLPESTGRRRSQIAAHAPQPQWVLGGRNDQIANELAGHFFLGPPVPADGQLLVLTEKSGQVNLLGLEATSGRLLWSQGLALVDRPVSQDRERLRLAFLPAVASGLALCPTPCGAVIAFDLTQHRLVWTAQYRSLDAGLHAGWRGDGRFAAALFPVQPVVVGDALVILPPDSPELTAFRLSDGSRLWGLPRRGAQQLAAVNERSLLQVSADRLARVNVTDGSVTWERSAPFMTGRGVLLGDRWLAPMADGRLLALDVATGAPAAGGPEVLEASLFGSPRRQPLLSSTANRAATSGPSAMPAHRWGNLAVCGDWIISAAPGETAALVQSEALHHALRNVAARSNDTAVNNAEQVDRPFDRVVASWDDSRRLLRLAEVELTLARGTAAIPSLRALVNTAAAATPVNGSDRARQLLQELLYARLSTPLEEVEAEATLAELEPLAQSPAESARWWLATLHQAAEAGDSPRFLTAAERLADFPDDLLIPGDLAHSHLFRPASCIPQAWERLAEQLSENDRQQLASLVAERCQRFLAGAGAPAADDLRRWIRIYDGLPEGDRLRMALALSEADAGRLMPAESLLLQARRSPRTQTTLEAGYALTRLWQPRDLNLEISAIRRTERRILSQSGGMTHPIRLERGWDGPIEPVAYRPEDPLRFADRLSAISRLQRVEISTFEQPTGDDKSLPVNGPNLRALLENRREFPRDASRTLRIVSLGDLPDATGRPVTGSSGDTPPQVQLALIHRETGRIFNTLAVPARSREASSLSLQPESGHFLPLADSQVYGVSLLDAGILWTAAPGGTVPRGDRLRLGPAGVGFCIVQTPEGVCNLDPLTGLVRWQRRDIAPDSGLYASEDTGILGDDEVLIVFEADQRTCRVLSTQTGEVLRTVQAPIDPKDIRRPRLAFGRRLFFATETRTAPRFRVWDAAADAIVLDVPAHPRLSSTRVDRDTLACVTEDGSVLAYDAVHGRRLLREFIATVATDDITGLQVWRDAEHWYVHLAHTAAADGATRYENAATDVNLPGTTINGTLAVIDRTGRRTPWQLPLQNRTVIAGTALEAPFLVTVARLQEPFGTQSASLLLEVIDKQTGRRIAEQQIERKRLAHAAYDLSAQTLSLYAEDARIDIRSAPSLEGTLLAVEEDPVSVNQ